MIHQALKNQSSTETTVDGKALSLLAEKSNAGTSQSSRTKHHAFLYPARRPRDRTVNMPTLRASSSSIASCISSALSSARARRVD